MKITHPGLESVKEYYGKILGSNKDLKTSACCTAESIPMHLRAILKDIHDEVKDKFYGCGSPIPPAVGGLSVLDLGSGSGRDSFMLSKLVGASGRVIGIDMTQEQVALAQNNVEFHRNKFGYHESNVKFIQGYIEDLESAGIKNESVDLVVSNCVINLSPNKERVFSEIFRVLKPGGELYFSDVFASRRIPREHTEDPVLLGECLGGAMYIEDFRRLIQKMGCKDYRVMSSTKIEIQNSEIQSKLGKIDFYSMTVRAFKVELEDRCEDYGQVATYPGGIDEAPHTFVLDDHHAFEKNRPALVCRNTATMLATSRFASYFRISGDAQNHFGLFDCGPSAAGQANVNVGVCC